MTLDKLNFGHATTLNLTYHYIVNQLGVENSWKQEGVGLEGVGTEAPLPLASLSTSWT